MPLLVAGQINTIRQKINSLEPIGNPARPALLLEISKDYANLGAKRQAQNYARMSVRESNKLQDSLTFNQAAFHLVELFIQMNQVDSALMRMNQLKKLSFIPEHRFMWLLYHAKILTPLNLGKSALRKLNTYADSVSSKLKTEQLFELAIVNASGQGLGKALEFALKAEGQSQDDSLSAEVNLFLAKIFFDLNQDDQAKDLLVQILTSAKAKEQKEVYLKGANLFLSQDFNTVIIKERRGVIKTVNELLDSSLSKELTSAFYLNASEFLRETGQGKNALNYALKGLELAEELNNEELILSGLEQVSLSYAKLGLQKSTVTYLKDYQTKCREHLRNKVSDNQRLMSQAVWASIKMEQARIGSANEEITELASELGKEKGERKIKNYLVFLLVGIVSIAIIFNVYQRSQDKNND